MFVVVVQLQLPVCIVPLVLRSLHGGRRHCFSEKNSVSVDCLLLLGLGVAVGWLGVVGVTVVAVEFVAADTCARRGWRLGPVRALRMCMASDVSLPLESVGEELSLWLS